MNYFDDPNSKHFSFESFAIGLDQNTFGVIKFKGYEGISKPYDFEIMLVSSKNDIVFEDMLQSQAVFTIHRGANDDVLYNGIVSEFDQLHEVNDVVFYRARLVPKLWWLTLTHHNQVFLNQSAPEFIDDALRDGGLESADIDIGNLTGYEDIDYICQYDESHFNFVSRWMERQGIYYYFTQEMDGEVLVLTDNKFSHYALKQGADLFYNPASGLEGRHMGEAIGSFTCRQKQLPTEIILKDYNYERPSLDITSRANVDLRGRGISYIYGEFFNTPEEGERLATIRAEELLCQKQEFYGESTVPYIMPGFTFNMHNHYRDDFNQEYLILEVTHEGNQSHLMSGGIAADAGKKQNQSIYHNSFKAIPNHTQYRPERLTDKPKISGTIHANIDSEVEGEYAQLDELGRYRVQLPFDINDDHLNGKGSAPIRMMQAYAGKNRGMQFPLVKGTEVLLTFIEGNPDRPVIAGAVSNPETQGPVNADNQSESVIQSGGNNRIRMEDKAGSERIVLQSPMANSWIRVGAHNDPITLNGSADQYIPLGGTYAEQGGVSTDPTDSTLITDIPSPTTIIGPDGTTALTNVDTDTVGHYQLTYTSGTNTDIRNVHVFDPTDTGNSIQDSKPGIGIRIKSGGDLWFEAHDKYGEYNVGKPAVTSAGISTLLGYFGANYNPKGLLDFNDHGAKEAWSGDALSGDAKTVSQTIGSAHVRVSSLDTFNTQEGNIYDFGGYWNYSLGNSYAENFMEQGSTIELNKKHEKDKAAKGGPKPGSISADNIGNLDDNTWIEKTIGGASYEYTKNTKALSVEYKTHEESHVYGKETHEYVYRGDESKKSYEYSGADGTKEQKWNKGGTKTYDKSFKSGPAGSSITNETIWDSKNGGLTNYNFTSNSAAILFKYEAAIPNKPSVTISTTATTNTTNLSLSGATTIDISAKFALTMNVQTGAGLGMEVDARVGGALTLKQGPKMEFEGMGINGRRAAAVEASAKNAKMVKAMMHISREDVVVTNSGVRTATGQLHADQSMFKFF